MKINKTFFNILLLIISIKSSVLIQFVPPNKEIEALQNDRYIFGIEDDGNIEIAKCVVRSDTGIERSFLVRPTYLIEENNNDFSQFGNENIVTDRGFEGLCQIIVSNLQDPGPKEWNLEVIGFEGELIANETFTVNFFFRGQLLNYAIRILESSSFINYVLPKENTKYVTCYAGINDTIKIDLDMEASKTKTLQKAKNLSERVSSLGHGYCGLKFTNATTELENTKWSLTAVDHTGISYMGIFTTRIDRKELQGNLHIIRYVQLGTTTDVVCSNYIPLSPFCSIFNPQGKLVDSVKCQYKIPSFSMDHIGEWKCDAAVGNSMETIQYTIELRLLNPEKVTSWTNETENYVNIGCAIENFRGRTFRYCKMVAPDERSFNIMPQFATERYTTLGTDFQKGVCSMMIRKPLLPFERGLWRCEIMLEYASSVTGTFIALQATIPPTYPKHLTVTSRLNQSLTIQCNVPYHSPYCSIQAPNGTKFEPDEEGEVSLGRCSLHIVHSSSSDSGRWVCLFGRQTGEPDEEIIVDVTIAELLKYNKYVEVDEGDTAELMCTSGGLPLKYCRYISPLGVGYNLDDRINNPSGITYFGKGLRYGDCGMRFPDIKLDDSGIWTCVTKFVIDEDGYVATEISGQIRVKVIGAPVPFPTY